MSEGFPVDGGQKRETFFPACATCKHWKGGLTCPAFMDGIPSEIFLYGNKHTKPVDGDHGIRYEAR